MNRVKMVRARRSDGDVTRQKILLAAAELIAHQGFAKTSNKAIAQAANVDLASINYHFKGRDGLYHSVLVEAHQQYMNEQELMTLATSELCAEDKLGTFLENLVSKLLSGNQSYSQLFLREILSSTEQMRQFMLQDGMRKFQFIRQMISDVSDFPLDDPRLLPCMLSTMAPCFMLVLAASNDIHPAHAVTKMDAHTLAQHLKTFTIAGLKAMKAKNLK